MPGSRGPTVNVLLPQGLKTQLPGGIEPTLNSGLSLEVCEGLTCTAHARLQGAPLSTIPGLWWP